MSLEGALRDRLDPPLRLIETFGYAPGKGFIPPGEGLVPPGGGFIRLNRHLARMKRSAGILGFAFDETRMTAALDALGRPDQPKRVRLTLGADGEMEASAQPFMPLAPGTVWALRIAATRVDSHDPLLGHKTTRRNVYEAARAEFTLAEADEVLLANERGEVCEGTITNLFVEREDGMLLTPALSCGLLPGILRETLIESGRAVEAVLRPEDLAGGRIHVGNSLRGLIRARLAS